MFPDFSIAILKIIYYNKRKTSPFFVIISKNFL